MALRFGKFSNNYRGALRYLTVVNVCLVIAVVVVYCCSGNSSHLASWCVVTVSLFALFRAFANKESLERSICTVVMFSYFMLSLIGIISVWSYFIFYGLPFAPYDDDSYYFLQIASMASGQIPDSYTLYEVCMVPMYWLLAVIKTTVSVQDLLPVNWGLGAATVGLATHLAIRVSGRFSLLASAALLINYNFLNATVHLYRDGFILVLSLLCVLYVMRKRYLMAMGFAFLTGLTRGGNGLLCFMYILVFFLCHKGWFKQLSIKAAIVCLVMILAFVSTDYMFRLGGLARSFMTESTISDQTILERAKLRTEKFFEKDSDKYDSIKLIYSWGPLAMVAIPFASLFNPVRWQGFTTVTIISVRGYSIGVASVLRPVLAFMLITIISWPVIGPRLVQGLQRSFKGTGNVFVLFYIFSVTVLLISLISFQARHRTAFEIFFPCFVALAVCQTRADHIRRRWLTLFFIGLVVVANVFPYLF